MKTKGFLRKNILIFSTLSALTLNASAIVIDSTISLNASYIADGFANMYGGLKTGGTYLGYLQMGLSFSTKDIGLWNGGDFCVGAAHIHGGCPSSDFVGDFQVLDNIEADKITYLEYLWYQQVWGDFTLKVGLQDLNENFLSCDAAGDFINSAFGISPAVSSNILVPIFPTTAWCAELHYDINEKWRISGAVYDGVPTPIEYDSHNLKWSINQDEGFTEILELRRNLLAGNCKLGAIYHTDAKKYFLYALAEQSVFQKNDREVNAFLQTAVACNAENNENNFHLGLGASVNKIFSPKAKDNAGLGLTAVWFKGNEIKPETVIEMFYKYQIINNISIETDFQYITNINNNENKLKNSFVGILRLQIEI